MLHLIPAPLHRGLLRAAHAIRVYWWRWGKPRTVDCRVVALDSDGRVLLVRHSYGSGTWMLPGGAPARGEEPLAAAVRELREEAGCGLSGAAMVAWPSPDARQRNYVVVGRCGGTPRVDGREVVEGRFFALTALPHPFRETHSSRLDRWLSVYREL